MGLYLVPASRENIVKTIISDVDISVAEQFLITTDLKKIKELLGAEKRFNCWAMTESNRSIFERMEAGDIVFLSEKNTGMFNYKAIVFFTIECEKMGNSLWPFVPNDPWKLIYFLKDIQEINIDKSVLVAALGYKSNYQVPGTIRVREDYVENIMQKYSSIDSFLNTLAKGKRIERTDITKHNEKEVYAKVSHECPEWLSKLIQDIEILQGDPQHKERAHESLVENFYELIGFKKFTDIKHRQGRIDISVEYQGKTVIVNEVKKDWNLSYTDKTIILQAYNYSLESGARFVVITNGDYYAIFDKDKGRSYESNFLGGFQLSRLGKEDFKQIDFLRKDNIIHLL